MGLPSTPPITQQYLRSTSSFVTFDPLSVATVLPNPRANASAVRLYTQYQRSSFRWPYLMMIGGTLPPLQALVDHVLSTSHSVHPALALALQNAAKLEVASNTIFKELPLDFSNTWIGLAIDYRPSKSADNDFMILNVDGGVGDRSKGGRESAWRFLFTATGLFTGAVIVVELVLSVFLGDMWATALFFIYLCHWTFSTLLSFTNLIEPRKTSTSKIREDGSICFAVHQRKEGGTVIFKGRKDSLECWARQTWQFDKTPSKSALHWLWILTGSIAAVGSTAAMVNMIAALQLGFLGLLLFCSLAELILTRISRILELRPHVRSMHFLSDNDFRTEAIIRGALEPEEQCRLDQLDWIGLKRLPEIVIFVEMQRMLKRLNEARPNVNEATFDSIVQDFINIARPKEPGLADRIVGEVTRSASRAFGLQLVEPAADEKKPTAAGVREAVL